MYDSIVQSPPVNRGQKSKAYPDIWLRNGLRMVAHGCAWLRHMVAHACEFRAASTYDRS